MSISSPPNYGSPDWQRGYYSAQKLLATANGLTLSVTVDVPPNAEALVVMVQLPPISAPVQCTGIQSGRSYIGARGTVPGPPTLNGTYFFDVSGTIDTQVKVILPEAPSTTWYVYADAGTRTTMDVANQRSYGGTLYTIPSVPSTVAGDHPLNEVQLISPNPAATGAILAAPGPATRYRVFSIQMSTITTGLFGVVTDLNSGKGLAWISGAGNMVADIPAQGYPLSTNAVLQYTLLAGAGSCGISVYYTVESV